MADRRLTFALSTLLALASACGVETAAPAGDTLDTIRFKLDFGGGVTLSSVDYVLKGPGSFTRIGTLAVGDDAMLSTTFNNLPAGNYMVSVKGSASDSLSQCKGDATFSVTASMTAVVQIPLLCSGIASVGADFNTCPTIDGISAVPAEVAVGSSIDLMLFAHDADGAPAPLAATWAVSSGTLSNLSVSGARFTCTAPGTFTINVRVSDGAMNNNCADTAALAVVCSPAP